MVLDILAFMLDRGLSARHFRISDFYWIWKARNNQKVRQASLDTTRISALRHLSWFLGVKLSNRKFCWVISLGMTPAFVIQATMSDGKVRWGGYGVHLESHPIGLGAMLPILGISLISTLPEVSRIRIELKQENESTAKRYEQWGFTPRLETKPTLHKVFEMSPEEAGQFAYDFASLLPSHIQDLNSDFCRKTSAQAL